MTTSPLLSNRPSAQPQPLGNSWLFGLLLLTQVCISGQAIAQGSPILEGLRPRPQVSWLRSGTTATFVLGPRSAIILPDTAPLTTLKAAAYLQARLRQTLGDTLAVWSYSKRPKILTSTIMMGERASFPALASMATQLTPLGETDTLPEGYTLDVTSDGYGVLIAGNDSSGVFYGAVTMADLVARSTNAVPPLHISDHPDYPVRWVFSMHNLQVNAQLHDVMTIEDTMARHKLNGFNSADFKYSVLDIVAPWYFTDIDTLRHHSEASNVEIIPSTFNGGGILWKDPDLAEGLPSTCRFVLEADTGRLLATPGMALPQGTFENATGGRFPGWGWYDNPGVGIFVDSTTVHSGRYSARCTNFTDTTRVARFIKGLTCRPHTSYHLSVWVRTDQFQVGYAGAFQLLAIGTDGTTSRGLTATQYDVPETSNGWIRYDVVFNSLSYSAVNVYVGVWSGMHGTIWFDDFVVEEAGLSSLLRRPTSLPIVTNITAGPRFGTRYRESKDYLPIIDTLMEQAHGSYPWHVGPGLRLASGGTMQNGDTVSVQFERTLTVLNWQNGDGYAFPCLSEDTLYDIFHEQIRSLDALHHPRQFFLSHDEWRVMGWDSACSHRNLSAAALLADNLTRCDSIIRVIHPGAKTCVWSDMFDSLHNAHNAYYLDQGDLTGDWDLIPKHISIVNWNGGVMDGSLDFFARHGFSQITSPYYDVQNIDNMRAWRLAMDRISNCYGRSAMQGMMYTTWASDYSFLAPFADYAWSAGPMIIHAPLDSAMIAASHGRPQLLASITQDPNDPSDTILAVVAHSTVSGTAHTDSLRAAGHGHVYSVTLSGVPSAYSITATSARGFTRSTPTYRYEASACVKNAPIGVMRTISVYPNPAHDALIIAQSEAPPGSTFELVREDGVVALTATMGFSDLRLDTHTVASGHYVLRLHTPTHEVAEIAVVVVH